MPIRAAHRLTAWSHSRRHDYDECPAKAKFKYLDKVPEPSSPALERGSSIHKECEAFGTGRIKKLPPALARFAEEFTELAKIRKHLHTETQLAVDARWRPCDWFARETWLRVVLDLWYDDPRDPTRRVVIDYKTGKVRPQNVDQLDLYAPAVFAHAPPLVEVVDAQLWYLDEGHVDARTYTRADAERLKPRHEQSVKRMLTDTTFKPNPGQACRFCTYQHGKGGPCKF